MPSPDKPFDGGWRQLAKRASSALADGHAATLKTLRELDAEPVSWPGCASVHVIRNYTVEPLPQYLRMAGFRRGMDVRVELSGYGGYDLDLRDPTSRLRSEPCDVLIVALWLDELHQGFGRGGMLDPEASAAYLTDLIQQILTNTAATVVVTTMLPLLATLGAVEVEGVAAINTHIRQLAQENSRVAVSDLAGICAAIGYDQAIDRRFLLSSRAPLRPAAHKQWALDLIQIVTAVRGRSKKVLVIDCDNTLWGGIVGEDGLAGLALDPHELPGRAFHLFQRQLLNLQRQGVLLALCSRNNESDVLQVLDEHPHCLIRREHVAAWEINWGDKAENVERLAQTLRLGLDSVVFVDDSPAECERVHRALPDVDVLSVTGGPAQRLQVLPNYDGWPRLTPTEADRARTVSYVADRSRRQALSAAESKGDFLRSLNLRAEIVRVSDQHHNLVERVAQLSQRTNQYNATGRRYTPGEIEQCCRSADSSVLALSVSDKFGDYGVTGAAVLRIREGRPAIVGLFVSCRVLGRAVETALLAASVRYAAERWMSHEVLIEYRPTAKNNQVLTQLHAFELPVAEDEDGLLFRATASWADRIAPDHIAVCGPLQHGGPT